MPMKMVIPKGRQNAKVVALLDEAGVQLRGTGRNYRPDSSDPGIEIKLLKSQNIPPLVALGQHDCGFAGRDWIAEQEAEVVEILYLGCDPVRIVACIPEDWDWQVLKKRHLIAVSEYRRLCREFLEAEGITYTFLQSYGATEVFPPEDADLIVDNTATGNTLKENRLKIVATLLESATVFLANPRALEDPGKRLAIEDLKLLFESILEGRRRVLLEMNCPTDRLDDLVALLPAMKAPTVARLYNQSGFSLKAAVPRNRVRALIPELGRLGATDILEMPIRKVVP